jgi:hypothetical protein
MQKFLRTLMLAVAMLLPFASQAQTMYLTVADSTATNNYVPVYGLYVDDFVRCQTVYPADMLTDLTGENILGLTYYLGTPATSSWGVAQFVVNVKEVTGTTLSAFEDMTGATTVYTGSLDATQATMEIEFDIPYAYQGGNLLIEIYNTLEGTYKSAYFYGKNVTGASWQGNNGTSVANITGSARAFMPKTTFVYGTAPTCFKVQNLTASDITSSSITLSWDDTINSGATYTIYDMSDTTVVNVTIVDNTAIIDELDANTVYTFGVQTDCGAGDIANGYTVVSARTSCEVEELPFIEDFSASLATDPCWRGASGTTAAEAMAGTALTFTTNQWTYESSTSNGLEAGHYRVNIYGASCKKWMITPTIDFSTASSPLLSFDAAFTAYSGTGVATGFENNATQLFMILASTDNGQTWDSVASISLASIASTSYIRQYVDLSEYAGDTVRIAFYAQSTVSGGDNNLHVDNVSIDESTGDICYPVSGMTVSDLTSNSATLTWNASADSYTLSFTDGTDTTDYTYYDTVAEFYTLLPNTQYTAIIVANCSSDNESDPVSFTFRTNCGAEELPFIEDFSASLATDPCWRGASGTTAAEAMAGTALTLAANNQWVYSNAVSNGLEAGHYRVNIYGTSCKKWMITPTIDFSTASSPLLSFDAAFTAYSGTGVATGFENNATQLFMILASTDNGQTWDSVANISLASIASTSYLRQYVDLSEYAGDTVRIAFYAQSTVSGGDNNLHIDNLSIIESTGEICYPVTNLTASAVTATDATLSWNGTDAGSYTIVDMATGTDVTTVTDTTYTFTTLTAMTQYTYGVVANCSSNNSDTVTVTFVTACNAVELPFTETFEVTSSTLGCWTTEGAGQWTVGTGDYSTTTGAYEGTTNAKITHNTTGSTTMLVSPVLDNVQNGMILDFAYVMRAWSNDVDELRVYTRSSDTAAWQMAAEYTDAAATWTVESIVLPGTVYQVAFEFTDNYGYGVGIDSVVFTEMSGSYCYTVSDLAVDTVTTNSITLSWNDANNSGATYSIYSAEGEVIASGLTATTYTVTGLTALTGYTFGVVANCSETDASNVTLISASTACAGATCDVYIYAEDSYGDGWNGASIDVMQGGAVVANYTLLDTAEIAIVEVCASAPVSFVWNSGGFDYEASFMIIDVNGDSLFAAEDASDLTDGAVFFTTATPCSEVSGEVTITFAVNDATMGTTTPAPGTYTYEEGETISLSAIAYEGYRLSGWHIEIPMLSVDTTVAADFPAYTDTVSFVMNGSTFTAIFAVDVPEATIAASDILYWVGEGSNQAVLAINWPDTALAWGYRFNGTATVQDMIEDIAEADPRFSYTIENGYLSDFTFVCENGETLTGANAGYWESKNNGISDAGMAQTLSNGDFEKWANSAAGVVVDSIYYEGWGWSYIYNYPMTIHPVSVPQGEIVTITFTVNDASMGTITPSGVQTYHVGETLTVTATPYAGYQLVAWQLTIDGETQTVTEDITTTYTDAVIPEVDGAIITAVFQRETGIDDVEAGDFKAYSIDSRIVVKGVENMNVNIYDVTGRVVYNEAKAAETIEFTVPSAGVYMVKAGNAPAKRVVVVR